MGLTNDPINTVHDRLAVLFQEVTVYHEKLWKRISASAALLLSL